MKRHYLLILLGLVLLTGIFLGVVIQKYYGIGSLLREAGVSYPTRTPIPRPTDPVGFDVPPAYQGQISLFILAGQSNMVGMAPVPDQQNVDLKIYVFGNDYRWRVAEEPVDNSDGQIDPVSFDRVPGFGPSLAFAAAVRRERPEMVIGLIPCAKSSSGIIEWQPSMSDQALYGSCLKRARAASPMGHYAGILFFQGETDTVDAARFPRFDPHPTEWSALFSTFVNNMREDLHAPELPVVFAQIAANTYPNEVSYWELVKEQQRSTQLPHTAMITTDDLPLMDDLHFTADSYRIIGERFAAAYLELVE
jgi:hypothetical protein